MKLYSHYQKNIGNRQPINNDWIDHSVNDGILYSHRNTLYDSDSFPSNLHYHDYYELIIVEEGTIRYISESLVFLPQKGDIILIPPGKFHMSVINGTTTQYNRHVFYFYPNAFDSYGCSGLIEFAKNSKNGVLISLPEAQKLEVIHLLHSIQKSLSLSDDNAEYALALGFILQFFYLLGRNIEYSDTESFDLPTGILELKKYIDNNYSNITSVTEVADRFFYSREHISRLFKKHFDISITNYILQRRILEAQKLILKGTPIIETAYAVGFNSISAFTSGFRKINGMSPSEYKKAYSHRL